MAIPTVKSLEWKSFGPGDGSGFATQAFVAHGIFGSQYTVLLSLQSKKWWWDGDDYGSMKEAKEAAQASYEYNVLSAIDMAEGV